jgi:outer membrane protein assembly factor BamA
VLGNTGLYTARFSLTNDTRDSPFLASQGHRLMFAYEQAFADFSYSRGEFEGSQYFLLRQRADGSGKHILSFITMLGFTGSGTPIFEHFFAGGFGTLRGFRFRGASPTDMNVQVGGIFQWINTVEYMFPITAGDELRMVAFVDFGTVEQNVKIDPNTFRVAPGLGMRITIPALGPAPLAFDFAVPVAKAPTDQTQVFNFSMGISR